MAHTGLSIARFGAIFLAASALAGAGAAYAQDVDGAVRLRGSVQLGPQLDEIAIPAPQSPIAMLDDARLSGAASERQSIEPDVALASALPWYERFTVAPSETYAVWAGAPREFQLQAGDRWGVTLGYSEGTRSAQDFDLQDFSAGAFFRFSDRVQVGGELRFTSPEEEIFGEDTEAKAPELRFESAFRF